MLPKDQAVKKFRTENTAEARALQDVSEASVLEASVLPKLHVKPHPCGSGAIPGAVSGRLREPGGTDTPPDVDLWALPHDLHQPTRGAKSLGLKK